MTRKDDLAAMLREIVDPNTHVDDLEGMRHEITIMIREDLEEQLLKRDDCERYSLTDISDAAEEAKGSLKKALRILKEMS